jgi:hypothetical protein
MNDTEDRAQQGGGFADSRQPSMATFRHIGQFQAGRFAESIIWALNAFKSEF